MRALYEEQRDGLHELENPGCCKINRDVRDIEYDPDTSIYKNEE